MDTDIKKKAQDALAKWEPFAEGAEEAAINVPIHVLLGESIDLAALLDHYWKPTATRGKPIPGFAGIASAAFTLVNERTAEDIRELQLAAAAVHSEYLVLVEAPGGAPMDRADFVLSEIRAGLEFAFDDGKSAEADEKLARLQQAFPVSGSQDATALALEGYAELADQYRDRLAALDGFEIPLIDEARSLAAELRLRSAAALTRNPAAQRQLLALRNRLVTLLLDRVRTVRRAAQYLYRNHPDVQRRFTSAYERRQRAARRRAARESEDGETEAEAEANDSAPTPST